MIQTNPDLLDATIDSMIKDMSNNEYKEDEDKDDKSAKKARKEKTEALLRFEADVDQAGEVDAHLSMTLEDEAKLLHKYSKIIMK